eukprot:273809_1
MVINAIILAIIQTISANGGCIPSEECQNGLTVSGYTSSAQYVCNSDGSKSSMAYEGHDCTSTERYAVFTFDADDTSSASFYDDVVCDGSCTKYIKYKEYAITDTTDTTCSTKYQYMTYVVEAGCINFGDSSPDVSYKWSCTDNSMTYTTYANGDCSGDGFGLTYHVGCDNSLGYPTYYEIEHCGSGIDGLSTVIAVMITSAVFMCYL